MKKLKIGDLEKIREKVRRITGKPPIKYGNLTPEKIKNVVEEHIIKGNIIKKYAIAIGSERTH